MTDYTKCNVPITAFRFVTYLLIFFNGLIFLGGFFNPEFIMIGLVFMIMPILFIQSEFKILRFKPE